MHLVLLLLGEGARELLDPQVCLRKRYSRGPHQLPEHLVDRGSAGRLVLCVRFGFAHAQAAQVVKNNRVDCAALSDSGG